MHTPTTTTRKHTEQGAQLVLKAETRLRAKKKNTPGGGEGKEKALSVFHVDLLFSFNNQSLFPQL